MAGIEVKGAVLMTLRSGRSSRTVFAVLVAGLTLAGCSGGSTSSDPKPVQPTARSTTLPVSAKALTAPKVVVTRDLGLKVIGSFGHQPSVRPSTATPPTAITLQVLKAGAGPKVALGQVLIANYQIRTWGSSKVKPVVVDDSFTRGMPIAAIVGAGQVLKNWDGAVIGQTVGSRVLVTLPGDANAASAGATPTTGRLVTRSATGPPMLAVIDIVAALSKDTAADGVKVTVKTGAGLPSVRSEPGQRPEVTSVSGIKQTAPISQLLLDGTGAAIDTGRTLVLQVIQVDATTSKTVSQTWGGTPILLRADQLLPTVHALTGSRVGSRALAVVPASGKGHAQVLVIDVISQV